MHFGRGGGGGGAESCAIMPSADHRPDAAGTPAANSLPWFSAPARYQATPANANAWIWFASVAFWFAGGPSSSVLPFAADRNKKQFLIKTSTPWETISSR